MNQDSKGLIRQLNIDFKNCKEVLGLKLKKNRTNYKYDLRFHHLSRFALRIVVNNL